MVVNVFNSDFEKGFNLAKDGSFEITRYNRLGATCIVSARSKKSFDENFMDGQIELLLPNWGDLDVPTAVFLTDKINTEIRYLDARGWPARTLWCELGGALVIPELGSKSIVQQPVKYGIETSFPSWPFVMWGQKAAPRVLPIKPIWLGFIINTIFYSTIVWITFFGIPLVKRQLRIKRGFCPQCAYDIRSDFSSACPECGWQRGERALGTKTMSNVNDE